MYPKEGLITLYQSEKPPIAQLVVNELNKPGYGEFISEPELNEALESVGSLTPEQLIKLNELDNINEQLGYIQEDITNINNSLEAAGEDIVNIQIDITQFIKPDISTLRGDISSVQSELTEFIKPDISALQNKTQLISSIDPLTEITTFNGSIISDNITTITNKVTPLSIVNDSELKISSNILHLNPISVSGATFILDVTSNPWAQNEFVAVARDANYYFITNSLGQGFYTTNLKNDGNNTILTLTSSLGTGNIDAINAEQEGYFAIINAVGNYKLINPSSLSYIANPAVLPPLTGDTYINITRNGNNAINSSYKYFFMSRLGKIYSRNADYYANHILHQNLEVTLPGNHWALFKFVRNVYVYISGKRRCLF